MQEVPNGRLPACVRAEWRPVGAEGLRNSRELYELDNFYIWLYFIVYIRIYLKSPGLGY